MTLNHYPRHVGDFVKDTVGLSLAERGAYTVMLDQYYSSEKPLPLNADEIYRMCGAITPQDRKAVDYVLRKYFDVRVTGRHQKRCDAEIAAYRERCAKASASATARWSESNAPAMRPHTPEHTDGNAIHKPVTSNQKTGRASRLPADWQPSPELHAFALQHLSPTAASLETTKFKNHWAGVAGARGSKLDWPATFQNWVLNAIGYGAERAKSSEPKRMVL